MNKPQYELIRTSLETSIRDPWSAGDALPDMQPLIDACQALLDTPDPALLQALGMYAVGCLVAHRTCALAAESETSRLLHRLAK